MPHYEYLVRFWAILETDPDVDAEEQSIQSWLNTHAAEGWRLVFKHPRTTLWIFEREIEPLTDDSPDDHPYRLPRHPDGPLRRT